MGLKANHIRPISTANLVRNAILGKGGTYEKDEQCAQCQVPSSDVKRNKELCGDENESGYGPSQAFLIC